MGCSQPKTDNEAVDVFTSISLSSSLICTEEARHERNYKYVLKALYSVCITIHYTSEHKDYTFSVSSICMRPTAPPHPASGCSCTGHIYRQRPTLGIIPQFTIYTYSIHMKIRTDMHFELVSRFAQRQIPVYNIC